MKTEEEELLALRINQVEIRAKKLGHDLSPFQESENGGVARSRCTKCDMPAWATSRGGLGGAAAKDPCSQDLTHTGDGK